MMNTNQPICHLELVENPVAPLDLLGVETSPSLPIKPCTSPPSYLLSIAKSSTNNAEAQDMALMVWDLQSLDL
ncbi:hypothetical protein Ancab_028796, partial [Ancistrocladus abbreviatus]